MAAAVSRRNELMLWASCLTSSKSLMEATNRMILA
jgi:hypothetical protein